MKKTRHSLLFEFAVFLICTLVASISWAVVGTVVVKDTAGNPVPEATISLTTPGGEPVETTRNPDGSLSVEEGSYTMTIRYGSQVVTKKVTVKPGTTTIVEIPRAGGGTATPPVSPGSNVVFRGGKESLDDVTRKASSETSTTRLTDTAGNVIVEETDSFTADQALLDQRNAELVQSVDMNTVGVGATFGLGSFGGSGYASRFLNSKGPGTQSSPILGAGSDMGGHGVFYPSISGWIGRADVDVDFVSVMDPSMRQLYSGDGLMWGLGGGALFFFCSDCSWFGAAEYRYDRVSDIDMTVTPALQTQGNITRQEFKFGYDSNTIQGIVGFNTSHVAPYGGIRGTFRTMTLDGDILVDFPPVQGFGGQVGLIFAEEFEENTVEGVVGIDFRAGHFVAGFEGSFDSNNYRIGFHGGFGF